MIRWLFDAHIHFGSKAILWREVIGIFLFTVFLGAVFHAPQNKDLYGQAGRQILFMTLAIYGWYRWMQKDSVGSSKVIVPRWTTLQEKMQIVAVTVVFFIASYFVLKALGSWGPMADAWIFTGSAVATYGLARGYVEFWLVWVAVDAVGVPLLIKAGYYPSATLYGVYGAFVMWGFISWMKIAKKEKILV